MNPTRTSEFNVEPKAVLFQYEAAGILQNGFGSGGRELSLGSAGGPALVLTEGHQVK